MTYNVNVGWQYHCGPLFQRNAKFWLILQTNSGQTDFNFQLVSEELQGFLEIESQIELSWVANANQVISSQISLLKSNTLYKETPTWYKMYACSTTEENSNYSNPFQKGVQKTHTFAKFIFSELRIVNTLKASVTVPLKLLMVCFTC